MNTNQLLRRVLYLSNLGHSCSADDMQSALEHIHDLVAGHAPELEEHPDGDGEDAVETLEIRYDTESWELIEDVCGAVERFGLSADRVSDDAAETLVYEIRRSR